GAVKYGKSLAAIIQFVLISFVLFAIIKAINKVNLVDVPKEEKKKDPQVELLKEIRDLLKK
ncbi:MAG: MscL family protein, partial [Aquirufa sp.]